MKGNFWSNEEDSCVYCFILRRALLAAGLCLTHESAMRCTYQPVSGWHDARPDPTRSC